MRVANCATGSSAFTMRGLCRFLLRSRWTPRTAPTPATAATSLRLRGYGRGLLLRHLLGNSLWRATGTTGAPLPAPPATTAPTALGLLSDREPRLAPHSGDAPEQRTDRGPDFLLHHVEDHCQQALVSRHPYLPSVYGVRLLIESRVHLGTLKPSP